MIKGVIRDDGTLMDTEEALREAALHGHLDGYPLLIVALAVRDYKPTNPSASVIASASWRRSVLQAVVDYYVRIADQYPLIRGTLMHNGFEAFEAPKGVQLVREKRMRVQIPDFPEKVLSGQIDVYYPNHRRLEDYKTASHIPDLITGDHLVQLAVYHWLMRWHGFEVDSVAINYIGWSDCRQVSRAELGRGKVGEAIAHELFQDEQAFIDYVLEGWEVIEAGYHRNLVPPMSQCDTRWCRSCPVRWACDQVPVHGSVIDPTDFDEAEYV